MDLLLLTLFFNMVALVLNPLLAPEGLSLAFVFWLVAGLGSGLFNRWLLNRPRPLLNLIAINFPLFTAGLLLLLIPGQEIAKPWPAYIPGLLELTLFWPLAAYAFNVPLTENSFAPIWECGLIGTALVASLGEAKGLLPYPLLFWSCLYAGTGLIRLATARVLHSIPAPGTKGMPVLPAVLLLGVAGFSAGMLAATPALGYSVSNLISVLWENILALGRLILYLIDLLGLNSPPQPSRGAKLLSQFSEPGGENYPSGTLNAPLWVMYVLWFILIVALGFALYCLLVLISDRIKELRRIMVSHPQPQRRALERNNLWSSLAETCLRGWSRLKAGLQVVIQAFSRPSPAETRTLYIYFLGWGHRNHMTRQPWQTPKEYMENLLRHPVLRDSSQSRGQELRQTAIVLTEAFTRERYGCIFTPWTPEQINTIVNLLRKSRLPWQKSKKETPKGT